MSLGDKIRDAIDENLGEVTGKTKFELDNEGEIVINELLAAHPDYKEALVTIKAVFDAFQTVLIEETKRYGLIPTGFITVIASVFEEDGTRDYSIFAMGTPETRGYLADVVSHHAENLGNNDYKQPNNS